MRCYVGLLISVLPMACGIPDGGTKYDTAGEGNFGSELNQGCQSMLAWMSFCNGDSLDSEGVAEECQQEIDSIESRCSTEIAEQYVQGLDAAYQCLLEYKYCGTEEDVIANPDVLDICGTLFDTEFDTEQTCLRDPDGSDIDNVGTISSPPEDIEYVLGTTLRNQLTLDDDESMVLELPMELTFFGEVFSELTITSNGVLFLGATPEDGCCYGVSIPQYDEYNGLIALGWGDLLPDAAHNVGWQLIGEAPTRELWIQYNNVPAIADVDEMVSSRMRWVEGTDYVDIFIDAIVYSDAMTIGVESPDGMTAVVLEEHNAKPIQSDKRGLRYSIRRGE